MCVFYRTSLKAAAARERRAYNADKNEERGFMDGDRPTYYSYFTPAGPITVASNGRAITRIALGKTPLAGVCAPSELTNKAATQVQEYLAGKRTSFSLPLGACGTPFQQQVWNAIADIPYAQTATAADIACRIGHAGAHRAVGAAARACPFAIAVPLHRLVRANGQPWGEGKPARVRSALLKLEQSR